LWAALLLSSSFAVVWMARMGRPESPPPPVAVVPPPRAHGPGVESTKRYKGIELAARLYAQRGTLFAEATIVNLRAEPVALASDRCGRAATAVLLVPPGGWGRSIAWFDGGRLRAFAPISACRRRMVALAPGAARMERWILLGAGGERSGYVRIDLVRPNAALRSLLPVVLTVPFPPGQHPHVKSG
jgi:hypothetical protein